MIDAVVNALRQVIDPELDESIVELGFVEHVNVRGDAVEVVLRLPTFWCAPNFAWLMAADARDAIRALPGIRAVQVKLRDHMYSDEISTGVSCDHAFTTTFGDQADSDDLTELRLVFWRKAFGMRQEQLVRCLFDAGLTAPEIVALHAFSPLPPGAAPLMHAYLERRRRLGLQSGPLITDEHGVAVAAADLDEHLRRTRKSRVSMTFNSLMCRGLLDTRYGLESARKEDAR